MTKNIERRRLGESEINVETRAEDQAGVMVGYAALFNTRTDIGPFTEEIAPGAFKDLGDVRALWNHDSNFIIGRTGKNLTLKQDERGLRFELTPINQRGRDVQEDVRSGLVDGMSFGFRVLNDSWETRDGKEHRTIEEVELWEISPVVFPQYKETSVDLRSYEAFKATNEGCEIEARKRRLKFKHAARKLAR